MSVILHRYKLRCCNGIFSKYLNPRSVMYSHHVKTSFCNGIFLKYCNPWSVISLHQPKSSSCNGIFCKYFNPRSVISSHPRKSRYFNFLNLIIDVIHASCVCCGNTIHSARESINLISSVSFGSNKTYPSTNSCITGGSNSIFLTGKFIILAKKSFFIVSEKKSKINKIFKLITLPNCF